MPRVSILRRDTAVRYPAPQQVEEVVAVSYGTNVVPPRTVYLPLEAYRPATPEELAANPRYAMVPVSEEAEQLERRAIEQDLHVVVKTPPITFDL